MIHSKRDVRVEEMRDAARSHLALSLCCPVLVSVYDLNFNFGY